MVIMQTDGWFERLKSYNSAWEIGTNMTQFPTIQARFDAALTIIEGAPTVGHNLEETKKLSADLDKAYEDAATAEANL